MLSGQFGKAAHEAVYPALIDLGRKGQREKCRHRQASHGSDVAEPAGKAAVPDNLGGMPFASKVDTFEAKVGRDQRLMSGGQAQHGAVVANAMNHAGASWRFLNFGPRHASAHPLNQLAFW